MRCLAFVSDHRWHRARRSRVGGIGTRRWRQGRHRQRPARVDATCVAGRTRRGHRGWFGAAIWRADGLRRPSRGLFGSARRIQAPPAGPACRHLPRCGRESRLPTHSADPRTAYSPREGDEQHLHGAGASRRDRFDVCRLPRSQGASGDRREGSPPCPEASSLPFQGWLGS